MGRGDLFRKVTLTLLHLATGKVSITVTDISVDETVMNLTK